MQIEKGRHFLIYFWSRYPALQYGIAFLVGICLSFHLAYCLLALLFPKKSTLIVILLGYLYSLSLCSNPHLKEQTVGTGIFHITEIKRGQSPFGSMLIYEGKLRTFHTDSQTFHRLNCQIQMKQKKSRPLGDRDYIIYHAFLEEKSPRHFILKTKKESVWTPLKQKSWAELRFQAKEKMRAWAKRSFDKKEVQDLMISLLTGQKENRVQLFQFGQIGLSHLLAISGFHFAILTGTTIFLLRNFLPKKLLFFCVILLMSAYFLYMGEAPSIRRAWVGVLVYLSAELFKRPSSALNALGVALIIALVIDPLIVLDIGFQLSFAATLGILLFYSCIEKWLRKCLPKRKLAELRSLPIIDQWASLIATYLRKVVALNLSVLLFSLPLCLFHFHRFPLIGLFYNLFFPTLFSLLILWLLLSLFLPILLTSLEAYSQLLLTLVTNAPKKWMFSLGLSSFPMPLAALLFLAVFLWAIHLRFSLLTVKEWELT